MNSITSLLGQWFPTDCSTACANFKRNIGNCGKVVRVVTSTLLGAAGLALATQCSTCSEFEEEDLNLQNFASIDPVTKGCLIGGACYGVVSAVVLLEAMAKKILKAGRRVNAVNEDTPHGNVTVDQARLELYKELLPRGIAGAVGFGYGDMLLPVAILRQWNTTGALVVKSLVGGASAGLYILDAGVGILDLFCCDLPNIKVKQSDVPYWERVDGGDPYSQYFRSHLYSTPSPGMLYKKSIVLGQETWEKIPDERSSSNGSGSDSSSDFLGSMNLSIFGQSVDDNESDVTTSVDSSLADGVLLDGFSEGETSA